jgi:hypothetical protein
MKDQQKIFLNKKELDAVYKWLHRQPEIDNTRVALNFLDEFMLFSTHYKNDAELLKALERDLRITKIKCWAIWIGFPIIIIGIICQIISTVMMILKA